MTPDEDPSGWNERESQGRFRERAAAAAVRLHHSDLAADAGFIGDGRLARWQADAVHESTH